MAESPGLFLSLLSGRHSDVSTISPEQRNNDIGSRLSGHPFPNDPDRLMDLLDALAAICVRKGNDEVFCVSLSMQPDVVTLFVSSNNTVPTTVVSHLYKIRGQLKALEAVIEFDPSTAAIASETSPDPNNTPPRADGELALQKIIYQHSYLKLRQHFFKRAPAILNEYEKIFAKMRTNYKIAEQDIRWLNATRLMLRKICDLLQNENPHDSSLEKLILIIGPFSTGWQGRLEAAGDEAVLFRWDNMIGKSGHRLILMQPLIPYL